MSGTYRTVVRIVATSRLPAASDTAAWRRWLVDEEIAACLERRDAVLHLGARLAAKRAVVAAVGWAGPWAASDMVVGGGLGGAPSLRLRGALEERCERVDIDARVSLSHTTTHAGGLVVLAPRTSPLACGFDLLDTERWHLALRRRGDAVVRRVTSPDEAATDAVGHADSVALSGLRFSLKECVIKALGGVPGSGGFGQISVPLPHRRPLRVQTGGAIAERMRERRLAVSGASVRRYAPGVLCSSVILTGTAA